MWLNCGTLDERADGQCTLQPVCATVPKLDKHMFTNTLRVPSLTVQNCTWSLLSDQVPKAKALQMILAPVRAGSGEKEKHTFLNYLIYQFSFHHPPRSNTFPPAWNQ